MEGGYECLVDRQIGERFDKAFTAMFRSSLPERMVEMIKDRIRTGVEGAADLPVRVYDDGSGDRNEGGEN